MRKQGTISNTTRGSAIYSRERQRKKKQERERETEAHLKVAIRREDYSIALTKYFQNTVKLQEKETKMETEM